MLLSFSLSHNGIILPNCPEKCFAFYKCLLHLFNVKVRRQCSRWQEWHRFLRLPLKFPNEWQDASFAARTTAKLSTAPFRAWPPAKLPTSGASCLHSVTLLLILAHSDRYTGELLRYLVDAEEHPFIMCLLQLLYGSHGLVGADPKCKFCGAI